MTAFLEGMGGSELSASGSAARCPNPLSYLAFKVDFIHMYFRPVNGVRCKIALVILKFCPFTACLSFLHDTKIYWITCSTERMTEGITKFSVCLELQVLIYLHKHILSLLHNCRRMQFTI